MKKMLCLLFAALLLFSAASAGEIALPYEAFVELKDGDSIDLNHDGRPEEIHFKPQLFDDVLSDIYYSLSVGDSFEVTGQAYDCFSYTAQLFAVEMYNGTYLFVSGMIDNCLMVYDIYRAEPWRYISVIAYDSSLHAQAIHDTALHEEADVNSDEAGKIKVGDFMPLGEEEIITDAWGKEWYYVECENDCGYVPAIDVRIVDEYAEDREYWTLRYVSTLECEGEPRDLKVSDLNTVSALIRQDGVSSPLYRRVEYYIFDKTWIGWSYDHAPVHKSGLFRKPEGAWPIVPGVYTYALEEIPLYADPHSDEIIDTTLPGEEYAILFGTEENRYYIQQVLDDPWETEYSKGGWFQAEGEYVLSLQIDGEEMDISNCFGGLHFGG